MPMNKIILIISLSSCINLIIQTLFDDTVGIGDKDSSDVGDKSTDKMFHFMNLRDFISIIEEFL